MDSTIRPNIISENPLKTKCIRPTCKNIAENRRQYSPLATRGPNIAPNLSRTFGSSEAPEIFRTIHKTTLIPNKTQVTKGLNGTDINEKYFGLD